MAVRFNSGIPTVEHHPKKTRQGQSARTKLSATSRNKKKKALSRSRKMKCRHCNTELIWSADHNMKDVLLDREKSEYDLFSTLKCPKCQSCIELYNPK